MFQKIIKNLISAENMRVKYNKMVSEEREDMEKRVHSMQQQMAQEFKEILKAEVERVRDEERQNALEANFAVDEKEFGFV